MTMTRLIALSIALCALLTACAVHQDPATTQETAQSKLGRFSAGVLAGLAEADDDTGLDYSGTKFGGRIELSRQMGASSPIEIGVRTGLGFADLDVDGLSAGNSGSVEALQFVLGPSVRATFNREGNVSPFLEGAIGFHSTSVDTIARSGVVTLTSSDSDSGVWYSLGAGIDVRGNEATDWFLGFVYEHSEFSDLDAQTDVYGALIGARIRF